MAEASSIARTGLHAALNKRRDLSAILDELACVASKWVLIGTCLGVDPSEIEEIEQQHLPAKEALLKLISRWLDTTDHTVTWADIVAALRKPLLTEERVAQQIEDDVCNRSIHKSISSPSEMDQDSPAKEYARSRSLPGSTFAPFSPVVKMQSDTALVDSLLESNAAQKALPSAVEPQATHSQVEAPVQIDASSLLPPLSTTSVQTQTTDTSSGGRSEADLIGTTNVTSTEKDCAKPPFSCGCGECSALEIFSIPCCCPNPVPTVSKFPYLDASGLTDEEREDLEIQLNEDYKSINQEYGTFASSLRRSLKDRNISPVDLADCLMELRGYQPLSNCPEEKGVCLLENRYGEIKAAENITRVFEILSDYSSFFNYDIIAFIARNLGSENDNKHLATYEAALETYCRHHIFECPSYSSKSSKFPDLIMKVDPEVTESDKFTLKSLRRFKAKITRALKVTKHSLKLCSIKKGCLEITFQIPSHIKEAIVPLSNDQDEALRHLGIQRAHVVFGDTSTLLLQTAKPQQREPKLMLASKPRIPLHRGTQSAKEKSSSRYQSVGHRICGKYLLLGKCPFGAKCRYEHSGIPSHFKPAVDYVSIPSHVSPSGLRSFLEKIDQSPERKCFVPVESDRAHVSPEIKIVAEDMDALKFAKELIVKRFEQGPGDQVQRARECIKYKLLGKCEHDPCKYFHGDILESPSIGYVAHPVGKIPNLKKVIGRVGYCKGGLGTYITDISDRDREKEVKVITESEEALQQAKKEIEIHFGQMHSLRSSSTTETIPLCYIHPEGVETHFQLKLQTCYDSSGKKQLYTIEHDLEKTPTAEGEELHIKHFEGLNKELPRPIYHLFDHPEETRELDIVSVRKAQVRLLSDYRDQIHKLLCDALKWMHDKHLHPKLEGRFGKLRWTKLPPSLVRGPVYTKGFINFMFTNSIYERYFTSRVGETNKDQVVQSLTDLHSEVETYDIKIAVKNKGKHDIRLKFVDQKPDIMAVKRDEEKLLITDILCLHRKHDLRLSLNSYKAVPHDDPTVQRFIKTVYLLEDGALTFVPQAHNKEWTARIIRHKIRRAYQFGKKNYIVTVSKINTYEIQPEDLEPQSLKESEILVVGNDWKEHYEVELHNLHWEVDFGCQLGKSPEQSLSLLMDPTKIPTEVMTATPQQWNPDSIMADFDNFLRMMDSINQGMEVSVQA